MNINVKGVWYGSKHAIIAMRENKPDAAKGLQTGGSIINTASFVAIMGAGSPQIACMFSSFTLEMIVCETDELSASIREDTASKGAVLAMTRELAMTHAREGIRANALCPYVSLYPLYIASLSSLAHPV